MSVLDKLTHPVSAPVRRALRAIEIYPDFTEVRLADEHPDRLELIVTAEVPLPLTDGAVGPFGIRRNEPVRIELPLDFPASPPRWFLREDFDRSHPHLQPGGVGEPPEPCLVHGDAREVVLTRGGMIVLLDQLMLWLERASSRQLIDPAHGWEPVRRDRLADVLLVDSRALRDKASARGGAQVFQTHAMRVSGPDGTTRSLNSIELASAPSLAGAVGKLRPSANGVGPGLVFVLWAGAGVDGEPHVVDHYRPESVATVADLVERAGEYGVRDRLIDRLGELERLLDRRGDRLPVELAFVLLVRRPVPLLNSDSPIELCPYVMTVRRADELRQESGAPVRPAGQIDTLTPRLLRETSGATGVTPVQWSLVGCGSVGSKLCLHAARSARPPGVVIDPARIHPHNFARHALVPDDVDVAVPTLSAKSDRVGAMIATFGSMPVSLSEDVIRLFSSDEGRRQLAPSGTSVVVDTTGSEAVRQILSAAPRGPERPRLASACLLGAGRVGLLGVEGVNANPDLDELMGELDRELGGLPDLGELVHGAEATDLMLGQGCASRTFVISDAQLSALTASLSMALEPLLSGIEGDGGLLRVGRLDPDGLSQRWSAFAVAPYLEAAVESGSTARVRIAPRVAAVIERDIAAHPGVETGGLLVGRHTDIGERFQVLDTRPAPEGSVRTPERFTLSLTGLDEVQREIEREFHGALRLLGTWHNHRTDTGPSDTDRTSARELGTVHPLPSVLLIRTPRRWRFVSSDDGSP